MSSQVWPGRTASIIVLPSGKIGDRILDEACSWAKAGLLSPAFWLQPAGVKAGRFENMEVIGAVPGLDELRRLDVLEQLGRTEFAEVKLIALRTLFVPGQAADVSKQLDAEQLRAITELAEVLRLVTPKYPGAQRLSRAMSLKMLNLIVAPPWSMTVPDKDLVIETWDWNIMLAPEDRATPFTVDAVLRQDDRYIGSALSNLATIAGLWSGNSTSSLSILNPESSQQHNLLWLHRTFVRGVIKQGMINGVTAEALRMAADPEADLYDSMQGITPSDVIPVGPDNTARYSERLAKEAAKLQQGAFCYPKLDEFIDPTKRRIGAISQVTEFLSFAWDKLKLLPLLVARAIVMAFNKMLNRVFQGEEGRSEVDVTEDLEPLARDKRDLQVFQNIAELERRLAETKQQQRQRKLQVVDDISPNTELWRGMRTLVFAALDGSTPPEGTVLPRMKDDQRPVVMRRSADVFFNPDDSWIASAFPVPLDGIRDVTWEDLLAAESNLDMLQKESDRVATRISEVEKIIANSVVVEPA